MEFEIVNECGHISAEQFLAEFAPALMDTLAEHLGRRVAGPLYIVLSDRATHETRFPPRRGEVDQLESPERELLGDEEDSGLISRYVRSSYAHGVTTEATLEQKPPSGIAVGDLVVYLDVESIGDLAKDLDVLFEAMLGRVAAHELSHALRNHVTERDEVTQGWIREGDAQRDAWHVLTELLGNPTWAAMARWGRAAQVRLSDLQPSAYRYFDCDWNERSRLAAELPLDVTTAWIISPPRAVFRLAHEGVTEVPISTTLRGQPVPGDLIILGDKAMFAGPWVVTAIRSHSRLGHPVDAAAIQEECNQYRTTPSIGWLQLRPFGDLRGCTHSSVDRPGGRMLARELRDDPRSGPELARLMRDLDRPADEVVRRIVKQQVHEHRAHLEDLIEMLTKAGKQPPPIDPDDIDPLDDWS